MYHVNGSELTKNFRLKGVRPMTVQDIRRAMVRVRPSTSGQAITELEKWTRSHGELSAKNV